MNKVTVSTRTRRALRPVKKHLGLIALSATAVGSVFFAPLRLVAKIGALVMLLRFVLGRKRFAWVTLSSVATSAIAVSKFAA